MAYPVIYDRSTQTQEDYLEARNGLGKLSDCQECIIKETLNGEYLLEMSYPLGGIHSEHIKEGALIQARRNTDGNTQPFRISEVDIDYFSKEIHVIAQHISRDLKSIPAPVFVSHNYSDPSTTVYNTWNLAATYFRYTPQYTIAKIGDWIKKELRLDTDFLFFNSGNFPVYDPSRPYGSIELVSEHGGASLFDTIIYMTELYKNTDYPIELKFNNWSVYFYEKRGQEKDISIRYGKNLLSFSTKETGGAEAFAVVPYIHWKETISETAESDELLTGAIVPGAFYQRDDPNRNAFIFVDFTDKMEGLSLVDINQYDDRYNKVVARMATAAAEWNIENDKKLTEELSVTIDFEYLDLTKASTGFGGPSSSTYADVGDYIHIYFEQAELETSLEIVSVEFDVIKERYVKATAGQLRKTLSQTIEQIAKG